MSECVQLEDVFGGEEGERVTAQTGHGATAAEIEQWERNIAKKARLEALWEAAAAVCDGCAARLPIKHGLHPRVSPVTCPVWQIRRLIAEEEGEG